MVKEEIARLVKDREKGEIENDGSPTESEIRDAIQKKKNGKSTTDWKNEILKRGGEEMVKFVFPVIEAFWEEEKSPRQGNTGIIMNVWKGKGDREMMSNEGVSQCQVPSAVFQHLRPKQHLSAAAAAPSTASSSSSSI